MNIKKILPIILVAPLLATGCSSFGLKAGNEESKVPSTLRNGGFESSTLDGWSVEYGDAYSDDSVTSDSYFSYSYDPKHQEISINKTGSWYLSGKGFDGKTSFSRTGAIRSEHFILGGDGSISLKLAGGAIAIGKGDAPFKDDSRICYVGVYTAKDDKMVARFTNEYFFEHLEDYVDVSKYEKGVYNTDNFVEYTAYLFDYIGEEMYLRIVDNDQDVYYGYLSVDDIRIGGELPQQEGLYYVKQHDYLDDIEAPSIYDIKNGGFETGSLAGWEVLRGLAFSNEGVNAEKCWWNESIPYEKEGNYHYGHYMPSATGRMRSSTFVLGGSGYVSFKLGGCADNNLTYLSFYVLDGDTPKEVARYSNRKYWNFQFPYVPNGMRLLNLVQYVADLRQYLGQSMYIEVVDENTSSDDLGAMTLDSIITYHEKKPRFSGNDHYQALSMISFDVELTNEYQVKNGTFETGDLSNWEASWSEEINRIGVVTNNDGWWKENYPYNKKGNFLFTGVSDETNTGYLKSSSFKVGGINKMSFLLGGARDPRLCYVGVYDALTDEELARYGNRYFHDITLDLVNFGCNLLNMVQYVADLNEFAGREVYLKVVDNATSAWGLMAVDSFITYYTDEASLPNNYYNAVDISPRDPIGEVNGFTVLNGNFETGDLTGWTYETHDGEFGGIAFDEVWWHEWYSHNKEGNFFFSGMAGVEGATGSLTSSPFKVAGQNKMSFRLGGGLSSRIELLNDKDEIVATYRNYKFQDHLARKYCYNGEPIDLSLDGVYMANMVTYIADLSEFEGQTLRIRIVDEGTKDWGLVFVDDFKTYYKSSGELPEGFEAREN